MNSPPSFDAISEPVAKRIAAGLARLALVLRARAWREATPAGITATQGQAAAILSEAPAGLRLGTLAKRLGVSPPTASETVNALIAKGLVVKRPGPDKRSVSLTLTPAGQAIASRAGDWPDFLARAIDGLDSAEQVAFLRALLKIIRSLQETGDILPQQTCISCRYFHPYQYPDAALPHHCAFVGAAFGDRHLRLHCAEYAAADGPQADRTWRRFIDPAIGSGPPG